MFNDLYLWKYDKDHRNCAHFAGEVWYRLTGSSTLIESAKDYEHGMVESLAFLKRFKGMKKTSDKSLAIALCETPFDLLHVGVAIDGKFFHLSYTGAEYFDIFAYETIYKNFRFYK